MCGVCTPFVESTVENVRSRIRQHLATKGWNLEFNQDQPRTSPPKFSIATLVIGLLFVLLGLKLGVISMQEFDLEKSGEKTIGQIARLTRTMSYGIESYSAIYTYTVDGRALEGYQRAIANKPTSQFTIVKYKAQDPKSSTILTNGWLESAGLSVILFTISVGCLFNPFAAVVGINGTFRQPTLLVTLCVIGAGGIILDVVSAYIANVVAPN